MSDGGRIPAARPPSNGRVRARSGRTRLARVRVPLVLGAVVAAIASLALTGLGRQDADRTAADAARFTSTVLTSDGAVGVAEYVRRFPDRLVPRGARELATRGRLDGATAVAVPSAGRRLLLTVGCAADDRSFEYRVTADSSGSTLAHGFGACGALHALPLLLPRKAGPAAVLVTTRGIDPFSIAVYAAP